MRVFRHGAVGVVILIFATNLASADVLTFAELEKAMESRQSPNGFREAVEKFSIADPIRMRALLSKHCCVAYGNGTGYGEQDFLARKLFDMGNLSREQAARAMSGLIVTEYLKDATTYVDDMDHAALIERALLDHSGFYDTVFAAAKNGRLTVGITPAVRKFAGKELRTAVLKTADGHEIASGARLLKVIGSFDDEVQNHLADLAVRSTDWNLRYLSAGTILLEDVPTSPSALAKLASINDERLWNKLTAFDRGGHDNQLRKWLAAVERFPQLRTQSFDNRIVFLVSKVSGPTDLPLPPIAAEGLAYLKTRGETGARATANLFDDARVVISTTTDWNEFLEKNPGKFQLLPENISIDSYLERVLRQNSIEQAINMQRLKMRLLANRNYMSGELNRKLTEAFEKSVGQMAVSAARTGEAMSPSAFGFWTDVALETDLFSGDNKQIFEKGLARILTNTRYPDPVETGHALRAIKELAKHNPLLDSTFATILNRLKKVRDWPLRSSVKMLEDAVDILESQSHKPLSSAAQELLAFAYKIEGDAFDRQTKGLAVLQALKASGQVKVMTDVSEMPDGALMGKLHRILERQPNLQPEIRSAISTVLSKPAVANHLVKHSPTLFKVQQELTKAVALAERPPVDTVVKPAEVTRVAEIAEPPRTSVFGDCAKRFGNIRKWMFRKK